MIFSFGKNNFVSHILLYPCSHIPNTGRIRLGVGANSPLPKLSHPVESTPYRAIVPAPVSAQEAHCCGYRTATLQLPERLENWSQQMRQWEEQGPLLYVRSMCVRKREGGEKYTEEVDPMGVGWSILRHCFYSDLQACDAEQVLNILPIHQPR